MLVLNKLVDDLIEHGSEVLKLTVGAS